MFPYTPSVTHKRTKVMQSYRRSLVDTPEIDIFVINLFEKGYRNSLDWSGWTGTLEWTTGLDHGLH